MLFSSVHIVHMHSFNFIKILSFDISNRYFYCFACWLLLSSSLVIVFVTHTFSAVESFLFISSSRFSCSCHRVCSRTRKPQKVLISNFFEVLRLYLILSTFLSILCAQGPTQRCQRKLTIQVWKQFCFFLRSNCYLDIKLVAFSQFPSNGNS